MASYTAAKALDLILDSSEDLQSGDESDIQEDPLFRVEESGDDSEAEGECADEGDEVSESGEESESDQDAGRLNNY